MFVETIIASFAFGFLVCALVAELAFRSMERRIREQNRARVREARRSLYRAEAAREHLGTPYIKPSLPLDSVGAFDVSDNDCWSRKAPDLKVLQ